MRTSSKPLMTKWQTRLTKLSSDNNSDNRWHIKIKTLIFQGECLSSVFFIVIYLFSISWLLKRAKNGYNIKMRNTPAVRTNHFLFMEDMKLYAPTTITTLNHFFEVFKEYSDDVRMGFRLKKAIKSLNLDFVLSNDNTIKALDNNELWFIQGGS